MGDGDGDAAPAGLRCFYPNWPLVVVYQKQNIRTALFDLKNKKPYVSLFLRGQSLINQPDLRSFSCILRRPISKSLEREISSLYSAIVFSTASNISSAAAASLSLRKTRSECMFGRLHADLPASSGATRRILARPSTSRFDCKHGR